jgi:hypothetical protein
MVRVVACLLATGVAGSVAGCAHTPEVQSTYSPKGYCFVQSGWQDSTSVCSPLNGYASCYLQCPKTATNGPSQGVAK